MQGGQKSGCRTPGNASFFQHRFAGLLVLELLVAVTSAKDLALRSRCILCCLYDHWQLQFGMCCRGFENGSLHGKLFRVWCRSGGPRGGHPLYARKVTLAPLRTSALSIVLLRRRFCSRAVLSNCRPKVDLQLYYLLLRFRGVAFSILKQLEIVLHPLH